MPRMVAGQEDSWIGLMDLAERVTSGWTLIGGQLVQLHCIERGVTPMRPTQDVDTGLDMRAHPDSLLKITKTFVEIGFVSDNTSSVNDVSHRWRRGNAVIDILIPRFLGERSTRVDIHGYPALEAPGVQQAVNRSEKIEVQIRSRTSVINRPSLLGALIGKAAALEIWADRHRERHLEDFAVLVSLLGTQDLSRGVELGALDVKRLNNAIGTLRAQLPAAIEHTPGSIEGIDRLLMRIGKPRE